MAAKLDLLMEKERKLRQKAKRDEEKDLNGKITKTNKIALQAIQKELDLEQLIEQEERQREKEIEETILKEIDAEKDKQVSNNNKR